MPHLVPEQVRRVAVLLNSTGCLAQLSAKAPIRYDTICFRLQRKRRFISRYAHYDPCRTGAQCREDWRIPRHDEVPTEIHHFRLLRHADEFRHGRCGKESLRLPAFCHDDGKFHQGFSAYRLDEVLGAWKPYFEVVHNSVERACKRNGVVFRPEDAQRINEEIHTWGPHPDVPAGLAKVAREIPLVILSNSMKNLIMSNVEKLGAPFHTVITAEETGAYKPHMKGFEYMFDKLGCGPEDITHVSSSFRYDLMTAYDLGIKSKVWVNRGHEPANPFYEYTEVDDIGGLAAAVGLEPLRKSA
jgi:2-haloalkanoic acid dehalogenase, type II